MAGICLAVTALLPIGGAAMAEIPTDFPRFSVPGLESEMQSLRELYWLHYPGSGPKSTLWDSWLPSPSLWPAVTGGGQSDAMRHAWAEALSTRIMEPDGYVATHQHASIAHPNGWPFPFWCQGMPGAVGWHFSFKDTIGAGWRPDELSTTDGWSLVGVADEGVGEEGWNLKLTAPMATLEAPAVTVERLQAPFVQMRWKGSGMAGAKPFIEWMTEEHPSYSPERRMYFDPVDGSGMVYTVIPLYKHPNWAGKITRLRVNLGNPSAGGDVIFQALFTQYDTRHDVNSQCYIQGCAAYFNWTGDLGFLRRNINLMRRALRFVMIEHQAMERNYVYNTWVGHDGRSGIEIGKDGLKRILPGHGIGDNYWDLIPFGNKDCYASMLYYDALLKMAEIERQIRRHPEWNVAQGVEAFDPDVLTKHAADVKKTGNKLFWNPETGRFINCIDADEKIHDYGYTFLNLEAIYYDVASPEHAKSIMSWLSGDTMVAGDTAQGADIYHWRFAPRCTTKRNIDYYFWGWTAPESIPWGGQVQDGGAVLAWSYHDLMSRLKVRGADDAWARLREIVKWFDEAQAAGGYRKYYDGSREGSLQGCGTPGGLGLDCEFFESVLVPQVMIDGFLGFRPMADGFALDPCLPSGWPELTIERIRWHDLTLRVRATGSYVEITSDGSSAQPCLVRLPRGEHSIEWDKAKTVRLEVD